MLRLRQAQISLLVWGASVVVTSSIDCDHMAQAEDVVAADWASWLEGLHEAEGLHPIGSHELGIMDYEHITHVARLWAAPPPVVPPSAPPPPQWPMQPPTLQSTRHHHRPRRRRLRIPWSTDRRAAAPAATTVDAALAAPTAPRATTSLPAATVAATTLASFSTVSALRHSMGANGLD